MQLLLIQLRGDSKDNIAGVRYIIFGDRLQQRMLSQLRLQQLLLQLFSVCFYSAMIDRC